MSQGRLLSPGQIRDSTIELGDRVFQLVLARVVCGDIELVLHFGACEAARFELPYQLWIAADGCLSGLPLLLLPLFHSLGEARFRVDESFSGITHAQSVSDLGAGRSSLDYPRDAHVANRCCRVPRQVRSRRMIIRSQRTIPFVGGTQPLNLFHPAAREWFTGAFPEPTRVQQLGWPAIARGESTLILAPTGSGKTLTAFFWSLNRLMFEPPPQSAERCRVLYVSPLKALAVDVERNLRAPLVGITNVALAQGVAVEIPSIAIRTGDTPAQERARFLRQPADILITTPESLFLMLTSNVRDRLASVDSVIIDEIHALVPGKRGAHLALSLERLEELRAGRSGSPSGSRRPLQRIGLSATQRPLDEVARFLGGAETRTATRPRKASPPTGGSEATNGRIRLPCTHVERGRG